MGTNYYLHQNVCPHCKRAERVLHIGKNSWGWKFSFRGYRGSCYEHEITTWADWKKMLATPRSEIQDEYGELMSVPDFENLILSKQVAKLCQAESIHRSFAGDTKAQKIVGPHWSFVDPKHYWIDSEGFGFYEGEFC